MQPDPLWSGFVPPNPISLPYRTRPDAARFNGRSYFWLPDGTPRPLYRGHAAADPSLATNQTTLPTFTDVKEIASVYAEQQERGRVGRYGLSVRNPLLLGDLTEDVATYQNLETALTVTGQVPAERFRAWADRFAHWRYDGEWIELTLAEAEGNLNETYSDTYAIADDAGFLRLALEAGYDGYLYRGTFIAEARFHRPPLEIAASSSYDYETASALEARPFYAHQIRATPEGG